MPIVSVGQITIVDVNDGVDGLDGPALQIISSAAGFTYQDGVASPADQTISFTLLRQGLDNTEANWAASGATLETNKGRVDITEYVFGLPGTGDGDTAYLTLAQFGTARQMSIGATVGSLAAYANVLRIGDSTAQAGATRNVLTGDWVTATAYDVGDIVVKEGFRWVCIVAHISSGSIMPPVFPTTSNTYWRLYGARGALTTSRAIAGSSWLDAEAATAIADAGGVSPIQGDVVTLFNTTAGYSETRIRSSAGLWTALSVIFGGNVIVDNTLTASKLQANTITASKLLVADFSNMAQDPMMVDNSSWVSTGGTAWTTWGTSATENPTFRSTRFMKITGASGSYAGFHYSRWMPVEPGQSYYITAQGRSVGGIAAGAQYNLEWAEDENRTGWVENSFTSTGSDTPVDVAQAVTAPAGKRFLRVRFYKNNNTVTEVRWGGLIVRRRASGELIVDGAVTTDKLDANSVTAAKIAAGSVTASKIAVGDFTVQARNWNFEEGDVGWSKEAGWTVVLDASNAKSGSWVARGVNTTPSAIRNLQKVSVEAGETFYAEAYIKHVSGTGTGTFLRCNVYNSAGAELSNPAGNTITAATTAYTKSSLSFTVPANAATIDVGAVSNITSGTAYVDEVRLFRSSNTTLIANGAITTDKIGTGEVKAGNIFAGAVTAEKIAAGSITASKIAVGDFQNLCPNPSGETGVDGWTTGVVTGPNTDIGGLPAAVKSLRTTNRDAYIGPWFDVTPGDQFYLSGSFYPAQAGDNPPTADAAVMMRFADDVGGTNSVWSTSAFAIRTTNSWQTVEGNVTVPAGKRFAMMALQINGTAGSTGSWHFRNIQVRRRNSGALIVDGAITTNKLDAGAVTAAKVSAGAITTSKLLVMPASICPDPYFTDEAWWTATQLDANGWFFESNTAINVPKQAALWSGATTPPGTTRKHLWSGNVTAPAVGTVLRLRARVNNGSNHAVYVAARFYNSAASSVGADITLTSNAGAGTQDLTGQGVVPANAATIRFIIFNEAPGAAFSGGVQVSAVMLDVAASADLIVDGAVSAAKISAGAITTDKLLVTGRGKALNDDPTFQDASAWSQGGGGGSYALVTESTSPSGTKVLRATDAVQFRSRQFPIVAGTRYKVTMWARRTAGAGLMYLRLYCYNAAGTLVNYVATLLSGTGDLENIAVPSSWTKYTGYVDAGAATVNGTLIVHVNWAATGTTDVADCRVEEYIGADLIVDGAITATKLSANSIAVGTAAIENLAITNSMIANTTITNAKIANLSVAKLTGAAMQVGAYIESTNFTSGASGTGWRINADGTAELQAAYIRGQVTASQINSNGLSIKDTNGNVILAAGSPLAASNITPASGWLNSNVSIDSNGNIQGIGTGLGTVVANDRVRAGGVNLVGNSGFLRNNGVLPTGWGVYNNGGISVTTSVQTGGMFGQNYYRVTSNAATTATLGLYISGAGNADSVKSWEPGQTYCISYWARGAAGAVGKQMNGFNSNMGFTGGVYLDNPALTNQWQRYVFRGVPNSNASTPAGELYISWLEGDTLASGSQIDICCPKVELGSQPSAWTPSPQDTLNQNVSIDSSGNIQGIGTGAGQSIANNVDSRINAPGGGIFTTQSPSISGAVRIRLPARVNIDAPMVTFTVDIYEYISGYSTTLSIAGHTSGTGWYNVTAQLVAGNIEYPVYFGHDGTYFVIWIGAASETWAYPQVFVSNVLVGYSAAASSLWASNWAISFDTSAAANVTQTVLDTYPAADWSKTARRPANLSGLSGSEAIQNSQIGINADGSLSGAGGGQVSATGLGVTGLTLINDNNCTQRGDTILKVSGGSAWNAGMRSREAYSGGAFASITAPSTAVDAMFGLNSNPTTSSYTDIDHAIYLAGDTAVRVYEEGTSVGTYGTWSAGQTYTVRYDGTSIQYMRDGAIFHQRAVTKPDPLFFDSSLYQVGAQLLGVRFGPLSKTKGQNLLDTRTWVYGSYSAPAGFSQNGTSSGGSNYIEHDTLPDGSRGLLWRAQSGSATTENPEGGWDSNSFPIDHTKLYRFTVWIRCFGGNSSGNIYLGVGGSTVNDVGGGVNGNPYFFAQGRNSLVGGEWYLLAGYVLPSTYSGGQQNISGLYRAATGQRVNAGTDFRWVSGQTTSFHRTYQYYTTAANNYQDFFDPRVELCDGTEPTLGALMAMGSPSARNQITSSNASTYIASAAIGDAQIANTIQSTNYSSSAGWQINKAGTATFNQVSVRGEINGGAYTGYAWPAINNYGFHLGPSGLLLGNANNNKYFQVTSDGNLYAPGFTVINGVGTITDMTITRPTALASGTHYPTAFNIFVYSSGSSGGKGYPGEPAGWDRSAVAFEIDTGYNDPEALNDVRKGAIVGNAVVTATTYWYSGTAPGSNLLYRVQAEVSVYASVDHYTSGTSGPAGGRLYARLYVSLPRNIFSSIYQIRIDAIQWQVVKVK